VATSFQNGVAIHPRHEDTMRRLPDFLSRLITVLGASLLLAAQTPALASPAVITAGQALRFDVDMSGLAPAPSYTEVQFLLGFDVGNSITGESHIAFFTEPGGQGSSLLDPFTSIGDLFSFSLTDPGFLDGLFSVEVEAPQRAVDEQHGVGSLRQLGDATRRRQERQDFALERHRQGQSSPGSVEPGEERLETAGADLDALVDPGQTEDSVRSPVQVGRARVIDGRAEHREVPDTGPGVRAHLQYDAFSSLARHHA
jgi:hypothetical protein